MTTKSVGGLSTPQKVRDTLEKCIAFYEGVLVLKHEEKKWQARFPNTSKPSVPLYYEIY